MNLKKYKFVNVDVLIGKDTVVKGDLTSHSAVKIDGEVNGDITTDQEVILTETATVKGNIDAKCLIVSGHITGNVQIAEQLVIKDKGLLEGDVEAGSLVIEEGGVFHGMNRGRKEPAASE